MRFFFNWQEGKLQGSAFGTGRKMPKCAAHSFPKKIRGLNNYLEISHMIGMRKGSILLKAPTYREKLGKEYLLT